MKIVSVCNEMIWCGVMVINLHFMKLLKPNFVSALYGVLICTLLITGACKKDKKPVTEPVKSLIGGWAVTNQGPNFDTHLYFGGLGEFTYTLVHYDNGLTNQTLYNGTYTTKGDSLKITIKEMVVQNGNSPVVKTPSNVKLYDRTIFILDGNVLTLKYITYPADAPVLTEFKFHRLLPD
ncbi:hypothetical protein SAMN05421821_101680 [Mucilaginibacter lappiensis]|nr:hypothetical protein SAMN05421821_101680 [Mucilaginibacter lappiensis]